MLKNDISVAIAVGRSRKDLHWKNKEMPWSELATRLSRCHRTAETYEAYMAATKTRRDEIKDIGGFVGGHLTGGRRKAGSVQFRSLITLDADFASINLWDDFTLMFSCAAVLYSTHSHSSATPRFRIVIPLSREVLPDEYEPVARMVSSLISIEYFDDTTYQPERLMYFPSCSANGEVVFEQQDGEIMYPDNILAMYRDWHDVSSWPVSQRSHEIRKRELKKQENPLEKGGVIGAFCKSYSISDAISAYLSDVYEPCDIHGRYSYVNGSTAAGLVLYDDMYAYSHHSTDPAGGKLCNAFDLVRIHKFGSLDENSAGRGNTLPSFQAMCDLAAKDAEVRTLIGEDKIKDAMADFEGVSLTEDKDWMAKLEVDRKGNVYKTINNAILILEHYPLLAGYFAYDDFQKTEVAIRDLPWRKIGRFNRRTTDEDASFIRLHMETPWGLSAKEKIDDAFTIVTQKNKTHPVKAYLEATGWDSVPRLDTLFITFLGAEDSDYVRAVTRKTLVAAVKRIYEPGCKFDYILTLVGAQGTKKSSIINKLGRGWVNESFNFAQLHNGGKEAGEQMQGFWIIEIPEMTGFDRADMNLVKNFTARQVDNYRVAYGRKSQEYPRQCIFIGNSNNHEFLTDVTGNRRFWPFTIGQTEPLKDVATDLTDSYIAQVWAEAVYYYHMGEEVFLPDDLEAVAKDLQEEHTQEHPWKAEIETYLDTLLPANWALMNKEQRYQYICYPDDVQPKGEQYRDRICLTEIWIEGLQQRLNKKMNRTDAGIIIDIMNNMPGWRRTKLQRYGPYGVQRRGWIRTENSLEADKRLGQKDHENNDENKGKKEDEKAPF